jgi:putative DNA primase/helicase
MDSWLVGVPNGVVDLRRGVLRSGKRDDRITMHAGVRYVPDAKCNRWERFLNEVFEGDVELQSWVGRALGYSLTGLAHEDRWCDATGEGENGKSVLLGAWLHVCGEYGHMAPVSLVQQGDSTRFQTQSLMRKRFVLMSEISHGAAVNDAMPKLLTGKDPMPAEIKNVDGTFQFDPTHKLWLMGNHRLSVRDMSHGYWRRTCVIPFPSLPI